MLVQRRSSPPSHIRLNTHSPPTTKSCNSNSNSHPFAQTNNPNRSKRNQFQNPRCFTIQTRLSSSNYQMGDARTPPVVPIPDPTRSDRTQLLHALETSLGSPLSQEPLTPEPHPLIMVISGPSGVGKDALIKKLREVRKNIHFVVTATSRAMRPGEVNGKDYFFVSRDEFLAVVEKDELLEHALVYGDYKGIPKQQIRERLAGGCDVVLRVDIQGAATLRKIIGEKAVFVFVAAESEVALVSRLVDRKTETKEALLVRIGTAREEMKRAREFDYVVVNAEGKLDGAVKLMESIIDAEKAKVTRTNVTI